MPPIIGQCGGALKSRPGGFFPSVELRKIGRVERMERVHPGVINPAVSATNMESSG
jgi:hypothetical protein